jgi:hypothetical protein
MKCAPEEPAPIFWLREFIDVQTIKNSRTSFLEQADKWRSF